MTMDVDKVLSTAEGIYHQIICTPHLTDQIRIILGMPVTVPAPNHVEQEPPKTTSSTNLTVNGNDPATDSGSRNGFHGTEPDEVMYQIGLDMNF